MSVTISLEMPEEVLNLLESTPELIGGEVRLAAAVKWHEMGKLSQGKAAEVAGLSRAEFILALGRYGVSPFQVTADELERELRDE